MIKIKKDLITNGTKRRSGIKLDNVKFIVAHDTGNPGSTAQNNVNYYKRTADEVEVSAHIFVDDVNTIECVPTGLYANGLGEKAWHVRYGNKFTVADVDYEANDSSIAVEWCHGGKIDNNKSYVNYVTILGELCKHYNLDPKSQIVAHAHLDPARRTDPIKALEQYGFSYEQLIEDVENYVSPEVVEYETPGFVPQKEVVKVIKDNAQIIDEPIVEKNKLSFDSIVKWVMFSSANPQKVSTTVRGSLVLLISTIISYLSNSGITITQDQVMQAIEMFAYGLGGIVTFFGLARKVALTIKKII